MSAVKNLGRAAACLTSAALCACAGKQVPPPSIDLAAMACPAELTLDNPLPLAFDPKKEEVTTAVLDEKVRCRSEEGGAHVLYQAFSLPTISEPYIIAIRSLPWAGTIMAPKAIFLDGEGHAVRTTSHSDFTFRGQTLSALLRSHDSESLLIIESDSDVLGTKISRIVGNIQVTTAVTPYVAFNVYTGTDTTSDMTLTPAGRIEFTLTPFPVAEKK